jgi:hypothetical protein
VELCAHMITNAGNSTFVSRPPFNNNNNNNKKKAPTRTLGPAQSKQSDTSTVKLYFIHKLGNERINLLKFSLRTGLLYKIIFFLPPTYLTTFHIYSLHACLFQNNHTTDITQFEIIILYT